MVLPRRGLVAGVLLAAVLAGRPCEAKPCPPTKTPVALLREGYDAFEGVVVDRWNEIIVDPFRERPDERRRILTLRSYRFQVTRIWSGVAEASDITERELQHGWYEGATYWKGTYPTYDVGERYLVFTALHDTPPHRFSSSCLPGARGDDIPALAAQLGAPRQTYGLPPPASTPFWQQPVRRAREWIEVLTALIQLAVD
jgi:hypothetical protein